jgi:hypothetical protein
MSALISFVDIGIERLTLDFELWCWVITGVITGVGSLFFFLRDIGVDLFFVLFEVVHGPFIHIVDSRILACMS